MSIVPTNPLENVSFTAPREGYGRGLLAVAQENDKVWGLCADLTESLRMQGFAQAFPERFVQVGVAEQNMVGVAAGIALAGGIPFAASFAVFNPGRSWDQVRVSVCYANANVKLVGGHAGLSTGPDGATHQALEDVAMTRVLPNLVVLTPTDARETEKAVAAAAAYQGPVYIRFGRAEVADVTTEGTPFTIGKVNQLRSGTDITVFASGAMVYQALLAASSLENRISVGVVAVHTVKPLDATVITALAEATGAVVTAEDAQIAGGLGGAIAELLAETCPVPMERIGVKDSFGQSGKPEELYHYYGMTSQDIVRAIECCLARKR
jgi:transketolase